MPRRILLADESHETVAAIARAAGEGGFELDAVAPGKAAARITPGSHVAALVRAADSALARSLREIDPLLPVVALALDRTEAAAHQDRAVADAVLVRPFDASSVAGVCAIAERLRETSARAADLEAKLERAGASAGRDLDFLKRLLFVEVRRSRRYGYPLALGVVSIDGWDELAPLLSAAKRTALLAGVLGAVTGALRDIDVALPFSEERLVVLMPHTKADGAMRVARRLCARIRERKGPPAVTASVGVATHAGEGTVSFGGLVKRATDALARAREAGGDRAEAAEPPKRRERISIG
jgi:diguanylate cyclase (GGDEF)-like protein